MKNILNITNGDSAVEIMKQAGIIGDFLPWRDVLHDGPVISGLSLEAFSELRAQYISSRGWGDAETIKQSFIDRDNQLKRFRDYEKVILWFEHDLYDQLQIIQILDWFSENSNDNLNASMICTENYLGWLTPEEMKGLTQYEEDITQAQLSLATTAWNTFGSTNPIEWQDLLESDTSLLPFLEGAILRQLEEYPDCKTGLSRTAFQALWIFLQGETRCGKVFGEYCKTEERKFLGDLSFWLILDEMVNANPPLLIHKDGNSHQEAVKRTDDLVITKLGEEVLNGRANFLNYYEINRWIGGNHLSKDNIWCWDAKNKTLVPKNLEMY